jgi:hypothetical protein
MRETTRKNRGMRRRACRGNPKDGRAMDGHLKHRDAFEVQRRKNKVPSNRAQSLRAPACRVISCRDGSNSANLPGMARGIGSFFVNPTNTNLSSL